MNPTHITWDHFDSCVHFTPFVHPIELPVQDKIPIIRHHRTLEGIIFFREDVDMGRQRGGRKVKGMPKDKHLNYPTLAGTSASCFLEGSAIKK